MLLHSSPSAVQKLKVVLRQSILSLCSMWKGPCFLCLVGRHSRLSTMIVHSGEMLVKSNHVHTNSIEFGVCRVPSNSTPSKSIVFQQSLPFGPKSCAQVPLGFINIFRIRSSARNTDNSPNKVQEKESTFLVKVVLQTAGKPLR